MGLLSRLGKLADPLWRDLRMDFSPKPPTFAQRAAVKAGETSVDRMKRGGTMLPEDAKDWHFLLTQSSDEDLLPMLMGKEFGAGALKHPRILAMLQQEKAKRLMEAQLLMGRVHPMSSDL